jgi:2,3-bisphosphoglycerate-independent phosphoglycerate mutase
LKYVVLLGDGMADYPVESLGGKTPLAKADKPGMDRLAETGFMGLVQTVPRGMAPGSDTANLSVLGYDPRQYYSGRSPFEAASMGVELTGEDVTFRCNLVTLSAEKDYASRTMVDHSADEISTEEAAELMSAVSNRFTHGAIRFYPGVSYRHLMVWQGGPLNWQLTPPHDILGRTIGKYLPQGVSAGVLLEMMQESARFLPQHPVNLARVAKGLRPANSAWIWGEGVKPKIPLFFEKYGLRGGVISAVDLVKGIGVCAGLESIHVPGATGNLHTDFKGKAVAALDALKDGLDFVYIHIEAPDECGHRQETENKVKAIEQIDRHTLQTLLKGLPQLGEPFRILLLPDHATPLSLRTHTDDPVPFVIYDSRNLRSYPNRRYDEQAASHAGYFLREGYTLMDIFLEKEVIRP